MCYIVFMTRHSPDSNTASTTLTVRMSPATKARLQALADLTDRSKSYLANDAIDRYLTRELAIVEGIEQGLGDMKAGRVVTHDDAMAGIDAAIAGAEGRDDR